MRSSNFFIPTLKENPSEAHVISHKLMLKCGMIQQSSTGQYVWLPLGLKTLQKVESIVSLEQEKSGACRFTLPMIQSADLWKKSGRYDAYGAEMLRMNDRHGRELLFGPTAEELITYIFGTHVKSYKQLPQNWFQIHWKFRDEIRPRFGVMRGREFLMKDGYSFDIDEESARNTYKNVYNTYLKTFKKMGLKVLPVQANPGAIGGDLSHEFHVLAEVGESTIYYDKSFDSLEEIDFDSASHLYAAEEESHEKNENKPIESLLKSTKGIEVGHIFYYGDKYTRSMEASIMGKDGKPTFPFGGCYGIGISRLVGAIIEANHDERGIVWPKNVSPFDISLINICHSNEDITKICDELYEQFNENGIYSFYDDSKERPGVKFSNADLMGYPYQVIIGKKYLENNMLEVKCRRSGNVEYMNIEKCMEFFKK